MPEISRREVLLYLIAVRLPVAATEIVADVLEYQRTLEDAEAKADDAGDIARVKLAGMGWRQSTDRIQETLGVQDTMITDLMKAWRSYQSPLAAKKQFRLILKSYLKINAERLFHPGDVLAVSLVEFLEDAEN